MPQGSGPSSSAPDEASVAAHSNGSSLDPARKGSAIAVAAQPTRDMQGDMRSIFKSTHAFEAWMRERTDVSGRLLPGHASADDTPAG